MVSGSLAMSGSNYTFWHVFMSGNGNFQQKMYSLAVESTQHVVGFV